MPIVKCVRCGEEADLTGRKTGDTIEITCNRCGHAWMRDTDPSCPICHGRNVRPFSEPLVQRARGTAYSVVGERTIYLCEICDAAEIEARAPTKTEHAPREDPWK